MKKKKLPISILIPTHERVESLKKCLKNIFLSTHLPDEIIILDSSKKKFGLQNNQIGDELCIRYYLSRDSAIPTKRNRLLRLAKNEICLFVDDDVYLKKTAIKNTFDLHQQHPDAAIIAGICFPPSPTTVWQDYAFALFFSPELRHARLRKIQFASTALLSFKKSKIGKARFDTFFKNLEDVDFCLTVSQKTEEVYSSALISAVHMWRAHFHSFFLSFFNYYFYLRPLYQKHGCDLLGVQPYFSARDFRYKFAYFRSKIKVRRTKYAAHVDYFFNFVIEIISIYQFIFSNDYSRNQK